MEVDSFTGFHERDAPKLNQNLDNIIVADNMPVVPAAKIDKLRSVLQKVFSSFGQIVDFHLPLDDEKGTIGYGFIEYSSREEAMNAVAQGQGYKLDKKHVFNITLMSDFDKYINTPEQFEAPNETMPEAVNLTSWLENQDCEDQYVVQHGTQTTVFLNRRESNLVVQDRKAWTDSYLAWSPKGSYLATFHRQGIALWGGPEWARLHRFAHVGVKFIDFSPCERYLVSWSDEVPDSAANPQAIIVWDIKTGAKKRAFSTEGTKVAWPFFKWSHDDKFFARMIEDKISVYETPSMGLLNNKSMKVMSDSYTHDATKPELSFAWSPSDNILSYWVPEEGQRPAKVVLVSIPERQELSVKNLFNVKECKIIWQQQGDYLCVKVDRYTKSKKASFTNFEIFHMREKLIPCDVLEMKEKVEAFSWEPCGDKFAVIFGETPRISVSFYQLSSAGVALLKSFEKVNVNAVSWSPRGQHCVMASLNGSTAGLLTFVDTGDMNVMNQVEHTMATDLEWDPTGRYVVSAISFWREKVDNGFFVWSFQGRLLQKHNMDKFYQLLWRPRPPTLLTKAHIEKIKKNMKTYQSRFEAQDKLQQSKASAEMIEKRRKNADSWSSYRTDRERHFRDIGPKLRAMRADVKDISEANFQEKEEAIEFFVREDVELLDKLDV